MDRRDVTKIAKRLNGRIIDRNSKTTLFEFAREEDVYKFKEEVGEYWSTLVYDEHTIRVWFEDYVRERRIWKG